jgi:hypothetical protein
VFAVPLVLGALAAWIVLVGLRDPAPVPEPQTVA